MSSHSDPRKFIEELISSNKVRIAGRVHAPMHAWLTQRWIATQVVVFSKSYCPYW